MGDNIKLKQLAEEAVDNFFEIGIDDVVDNIVGKIAETEHIDEEDDINYLKNLIKKSILKWD